MSIFFLSLIFLCLTRVRFAGADIIFIAIISVLYYLMRNSTAYQKLKAEIDAAFSDSTLSTPVPYKTAIKLPYLKAGINESMRLHPGVALAMPREVQADGATISDFHFPAGYRVGVNPAVVQYDKDDRMSKNSIQIAGWKVMERRWKGP
ncbi:uncharacterized protein TRUGW13939_01766 [Talaromyces rugulosus]|uniref:Cytochrome P450 n=1 Tax=Talaromyces rugulosus TaxID=121627 RepID=A0A7H8QL99_TALRU|nr:uncharacterized protein TRUGW13939_01766 [Talaromyces rugulosus]QKX54678.1 hypothetical protein TRUGW13939_01766 [Talaromyces rugulosus]